MTEKEYRVLELLNRRRYKTPTHGTLLTHLIFSKETIDRWTRYHKIDKMTHGYLGRMQSKGLIRSEYKGGLYYAGVSITELGVKELKKYEDARDKL